MVANRSTCVISASSAYFNRWKHEPEFHQDPDFPLVFYLWRPALNELVLVLDIAFLWSRVASCPNLQDLAKADFRLHVTGAHCTLAKDYCMLMVLVV